jgi:hypothetical protein
MRHAAALLTLFLLAACAAVEQTSNPFFSSLLSREDIANITALVAQRSDIQQPIYEITTEDPRRYRFVVRTGDRYRDGAPSDRFTVQKLRGTWRIVSPVSHERIKLERVIITQMNTPKGLTRRCS